MIAVVVAVNGRLWQEISENCVKFHSGEENSVEIVENDYVDAVNGHNIHEISVNIVQNSQENSINTIQNDSHNMQGIVWKFRIKLCK